MDWVLLLLAAAFFICPVWFVIKHGGFMGAAHEVNYRKGRRAFEYGNNIERNNQYLIEEMRRRGDLP